MHATVHTLGDLFSQLGLEASDTAIAGFIDGHARLPAHQRLADAPFWTPSQAAFLREEMLGDSDWSEVVDELNLRLHA